MHMSRSVLKAETVVDGVGPSRISDGIGMGDEWWIFFGKHKTQTGPNASFKFMTGVATTPSRVGPISAEHQQKPRTTRWKEQINRKKKIQKKKLCLCASWAESFWGMQSLQFEENLNISGMISPEKDHTTCFFFEWNSLRLWDQKKNGDISMSPWDSMDTHTSHQNHVKERIIFFQFLISLFLFVLYFFSIHKLPLDTRFHIEFFHTQHFRKKNEPWSRRSWSPWQPMWIQLLPMVRWKNG